MPRSIYFPGGALLRSLQETQGRSLPSPRALQPYWNPKPRGTCIWRTRDGMTELELRRAGTFELRIPPLSALIGLVQGRPEQAAHARVVERPCGVALRIGCVSAGKARAGVPGRSREQRLGALQQANEIRLARAKLKKDLASGKLELAQILAEPPECVRTARLRELLLVLPKIGSVKAGRILAQCGIAHSKTLAGLTDRQRADLLTLFRR